jgi:hypothetical protein
MKRSFSSPAYSVSSKRSRSSEASRTTAASILPSLVQFLKTCTKTQHEIIMHICHNPCEDPFFMVISMPKGQLMEMRGRHLYKQESNQATIKAQTSHIEELTVEIEKTAAQAAELQTQYLEVHNALLIANENLANHKKAKEESALSVEMASLENRALEVLIELAVQINRQVGEKPFRASSLGDVRKVMNLHHWDDISVMSVRKTLAHIRILDNFGLLQCPDFLALWEEGSYTGDVYMKWVNRNRRDANIAVGRLPCKMTMQVRLADYLGIPSPSFDESSDDESDDAGGEAGASDVPSVVGIPGGIILSAVSDNEFRDEMKRRGLGPL